MISSAVPLRRDRMAAEYSRDLAVGFGEELKKAPARLRRSKAAMRAIKRLYNTVRRPDVARQPWVQQNLPQIGRLLKDALKVQGFDEATATALLQAKNELEMQKMLERKRGGLGLVFLLLPAILVAAGLIGFIEYRRIVEAREETERLRLRERITELKADAAKSGVSGDVVSGLSNLESAILGKNTTLALLFAGGLLAGGAFMFFRGGKRRRRR